MNKANAFGGRENVSRMMGNVSAVKLRRAIKSLIDYNPFAEREVPGPEKKRVQGRKARQGGEKNLSTVS